MKTLLSVALILLCTVVPAAFGQATDSNLIGAVVDATGAAVPNANIEITNQATGVKSIGRSGAAGEYRINNLPPGIYDLTATASGFATTSLKNLRLDLNKNTTANVTLQVGTVSTALEVSEAAVTIDTTTAQVGTTFDSKQIVDLPIIENANGLYGALNLSLLSAGVGSNGGVGQGTGPSVGGQRPMNNNFMIEGVDNNNKTITGPLVYVPQEATAEFSLMNNQYNSEFGHSTGGQFNTIVKSGSNAVHGSLYEYFQNRNLNAVDQSFARQGITSNPRFDQNKLGASIGGPIIKDKLFYFGNFEYAPLGQFYTLSTPIDSPTAAGYALLDKMVGQKGFSTANYNVFKQYVGVAPAPDLSCKGGCTTPVNGVDIPLGVLPVVGSYFNNFYTGVGSVDYNPSTKDQIRGRFIFNRSDALDNNANLPAFWTTLPQRYYLVSVSDFHSFTPNVTNELRLAFNRFSQFYVVGNQQYPGLDSFPNITFDNDLGLQLGADPNAPQYAIQNTYQLVDNINWTKGKHTFKFGGDLRDSISPQHFIQRQRGDYDYTTLGLFLTDQVPDDLAERNLGDTTYYGNQWATYLYGTDQWRLRPNLTVNLGLRWERTSVPETMGLQSLNSLSSVPGLIDFHSPTTANKNFAPRIGIAYSPGTSGRTSIRAGFGLGYDVIFDNVGSTAYPPQLSSTFDAGNYPKIYPDAGPFLASGGIKPGTFATGANLSVADARAATSSYIYDQKLPYSIQWNVGVQHVFHNDYTLESRYLGTRGVHLLTQIQIDKTNTPVTAARGLPTYTQAPSQAALDTLPVTLAQLTALDAFTPAYKAAGFTSNITAWPPIGNSLYHGWANQITRRFSHGLQFIGAYTWSHNIDDSTATHFSTLLTPRRTQDFANLANDRSSSAIDRRQRFTLSWVYESQWMNSSHSWLMKNVVGNWHFVGTYTAETGELADVQSGVDSNLNGDSAGDRAIVNPSGDPHVGSGVKALTNSAGATVAYLALNPNAGYIQAAKGAFPSAGRNTLQTPGINNFDISVGKNFNVTERLKVTLRGDFSNILNHPQYTAGYINSVRLTSQISDRTFLEPQSSNFENWSNSFPSNARSGQLALRVTF